MRESREVRTWWCLCRCWGKNGLPAWLLGCSEVGGEEVEAEEEDEEVFTVSTTGLAAAEETATYIHTVMLCYVMLYWTRRLSKPSPMS